MRYLTCESCRFDPAQCARRSAVASAVAVFNQSAGADSRLTAIRFLCPDRLIGYEVGRRVQVEEAVFTHEGYLGGWDTILGWIVDQKGDRVRIFLDEETSRKKRLIWLRPLPPRRDSDAIGVRPMAERVSPDEVRQLMVREIRSARGEVGDDELWCQSCRRWFGLTEPRYKACGTTPWCPSCDVELLSAEQAVKEIAALQLH
jgi:hypothetical protein